MSKVLVTGGAGFIGSHIVDRFLQSGHTVLAVDNLSSGSLKNLAGQARFFEMDIRSCEFPALLNKEQPELVIHTAAQMSVRESMYDPRHDTDVNVAGLINMLCEFRGGWKPFLVFLSTGGAIYGEQEVFPAPEDHAILPASVYGLAKFVSERYLDLWSRQFGLQHCVLRLANIYGPRQNPHGEAGVVAIFSRRLLSSEQCRINGEGRQTRDYLFVGDVADGVKSVCDKRIKGTFNLGTGLETSVNDLYALMCEAAGKTMDAVHGPALPGEQMRSCVDAGLALRTFGWKAKVALKEGLKETVRWFSENRDR